MMLDSVKQYIIKNVGIKHKFAYKGSRNQIEEFYGEIRDIYPRIFTIVSSDNKIKSFSYSDILISNLKIFL